VERILASSLLLLRLLWAGAHHGFALLPSTSHIGAAFFVPMLISQPFIFSRLCFNSRAAKLPFQVCQQYETSARRVELLRGAERPFRFVVA